MIVLGIDTSGYINAVGLIDGARVLADNRFPARTDTLEQIVDNIDATLKQAGLMLKDVEGIGVGLGPGSWTGIKVGVTVGKMLAFSSGKPVAGIPTLDALAYGTRNETLPVYAVIAAGVKDMVYAARYHFKDGTPVRDGDYFAGDVRGLAKLMHEPVVLIGPRANYYREILIKDNEPAQDKTKAKIFPAGEENLHNVEKTEKNEPAQSGGIDSPAGMNKSSENNDFNTINDEGKYEPAQTWWDNSIYTLSIKPVENEPAGAAVAWLALLRLQQGVKDNPLGLAPMYLKESTAKVFVNKYLGNK